MTQGSWRQFDWLLLGATIILTVFGILMIRSATLGAIDPDLINRVPDQIRFSILGLLVLFGLATLDYRLLGGLHQWLYIIMIVLLLLVQFFGVEGDGGAQSWLNIGIRIQPSEIAKVLIIITLGMFLARNWEKMGELSTIIKSGIHIGIPTALIFIQPDLGMTIVFAVMWIVMVCASGLRLKHIATFALIVGDQRRSLSPWSGRRWKVTSASASPRSCSQRATATLTTTSCKRVSPLVPGGCSAKVTLRARKTPGVSCGCATPTSSSR
ncbi:MAG: FtsW/RodA/SpoVE family cell cycle protein [Chloroflexi bacterium]|nr:FtsW/RodA/SpoVE family cell cycle protein [Chloroflexota bacterium]